MTPVQMAQLASALLAVCTPWMVVRVVCRVAQSYARAVGHAIALPGWAAWLGRLTLASAALVVGVAIGGVTAASLFLIAGAAFAALSVVALRLLGEIDRLTKPAREVSASQRSATLAVRRASQYLPWTWRFGTYALALGGVAAFVLRLSLPADGRRLFVPVTLAAGSVVFLWLYETWIHQIVAGGVVSDGRDAPDARRRFVRRVFGMETLLVAGGLAGAHALLNVSWDSHGTFAAAVSLSVGILGVVGCALALSSELTRRQYKVAPDAPVGHGPEVR